MDITSHRSSLIRRMQYLPLVGEFKRSNPGKGLLIVTFRTTSDPTSVVYLVPSWVAGLIASASARQTSLGRLYNRLIKGKNPGLKLDTSLLVLALNKFAERSADA